jgi:AcrR family transcriptional regulator
MKRNQGSGGSDPRRRTQSERRETARQRLCQAAIESLAELGYAGASTSDIAKRAGLSQGGLFAHYPSKSALFAAAADAMYADMRAEYRRSLRAADPTQDGAAAGIRILWDLYRRPEMKASLELSMAARTDAGLRRALQPVFARATAENQALAAELLPGTRLARPGVLNAVIWAIQGAAMDTFVTLDVAEVGEFLDILRELVQPAGTDPPA